GRLRRILLLRLVATRLIGRLLVLISLLRVSLLLVGLRGSGFAGFALLRRALLSRLRRRFGCRRLLLAGRFVALVAQAVEKYRENEQRGDEGRGNLQAAGALFSRFRRISPDGNSCGHGVSRGARVVFTPTTRKENDWFRWCSWRFIPCLCRNFY